MLQSGGILNLRVWIAPDRLWIALDQGAPQEI